MPRCMWRLACRPILRRLATLGGLRGAVATGALAVLDASPQSVGIFFL